MAPQRKQPDARLPEVGVIVRFKMDDDPETYRPAIVTAVNEEGSVDLSVFITKSDMPPKYGTRLQLDSYIGHYAESVREGKNMGQWSWQTTS